MVSSCHLFYFVSHFHHICPNLFVYFGFIFLCLWNLYFAFVWIMFYNHRLFSPDVSSTASWFLLVWKVGYIIRYICYWRKLVRPIISAFITLNSFKFRFRFFLICPKLICSHVWSYCFFLQNTCKKRFRIFFIKLIRILLAIGLSISFLKWFYYWRLE